MSVFEKHREELEHYETMMGPHRGRLAVPPDRASTCITA